MNITPVRITDNAIALVNIATVDGEKVKFARGNSARFRIKSDGALELRNLEVNYSPKFISIFDNPWDNFSEMEKAIIIAAVLKMGKFAVSIGRDVVSIIDASVYLASGFYVPQPEKPKHASKWEPVKEFGISGHRREPVSRPKEPTRSSSSSSASTGGLLLGLAAIAVIGILGAATSNKN